MSRKQHTSKVRPKKFLGQHFLTDETIAGKIAGIIAGTSVDVILEIGPGTGVMTKYLLEQQTPVEVVEIDHESVAYLQAHFPDLKHNIHSTDFLTMDLAGIFAGQSIGVIGNFPYNISSQILFKVLDNKAQIPFFGGMFQKEVAQRIAAEPGSKTYGILSVLAQAYYDITYLFTVPPNVFNPPPRKTLRNSLKSFDLPDKLREDVIFARRPEQLHYTEFIELTALISNHLN